MIRQRGFSTLEMLCSFLLIAPLFYTYFSTLQLAHSTYLQSVNRYVEQRAVAKVQEELSRGLRALDLNPIEIFPRVHAAGEILYFDRSLHQITQSRFAPHHQSDAVTFVRLDWINLYQAKHIAANGESVTLHACPRFSNQFRPKELQSYLGITANNFFELTGEVSSPVGRARCRDFSLRSTRGMLSSKAKEQELNLVRSIVPIQELYTLYIDGYRDLRRVSHRGTQTIENQPILSRVGDLSLVGEITEGQLFSLQAKLSREEQEISSLQLAQTVGKTPHLNLILNR